MGNRGGRWRTRSLCVAALAVMAAGVIQSQEATSSMRGSVADPSDAAVAHAEVSAIQIENRLDPQRQERCRGRLSFCPPAGGSLPAEATAAGFQKYVQNGITLSVNQVALVPIRLTVGSSQQSVQVNADAVQLQTSNDLGKTVLSAIFSTCP